MNKRIKKVISVFLALLFIFHTSVSVAATSGEYVVITVYSRSDTEKIYGKRYTGTSVPPEFDDDKYTADGAVKILPESYRYNCFAYAFSFGGDISGLSNNELFNIDDPSLYIDCYRTICGPAMPEDIDASDIQVGDLILYYPNQENPNCQMVPEDQPYTHVAIVISTADDIEDIVVKSKWGENGVYEHPIFACPYFTFGHTDDLNRTYEDDSIKVIRADHGDDTIIGQSNEIVHICRCADCGIEYEKTHSFYHSGNLYYCACGYSTRFPIITNSVNIETETE